MRWAVPSRRTFQKWGAPAICIIFIILIGLFVHLSLVPAFDFTPEQRAQWEQASTRFTWKPSPGGWRGASIVTDQETGVKYLALYSSHGLAVTPLLPKPTP